jgi:hypothetical protein
MQMFTNPDLALGIFVDFSIAIKLLVLFLHYTIYEMI